MTEIRTHALPIRRVTAFEDRAEVVRWGEIDLEEGRLELRVPQVSLLMSDAQMTAWVEALEEGGAAPARVDEARVEHRWIPREDGETRRAQLQAELEAAEADLRRARARLTRAEARREEAKGTLKAYGLRLHEGVWAREVEGVDEALGGFDEVDALHRALTEAAWALRDEEREIVERLEVLRAAIRDLPEEALKREATLIIRMSADAACRIKLSVAAVMPCALWRPAHEARWRGDQVSWGLLATVWQRTGEDWDGVELRLSTDRPSAIAELPPLLADRLHLQEREQKKRIVLAHREEGVKKGGAAVEQVPGVYDGGEARVYLAEGSISVPSDGRPYRFELERFEAGSDLSLAAHPELSPQVFTRASLENPLPKPLLAGPVTLVRDGAYMGVGDIQYVGPGERFELSLGSDDRFSTRLRRERLVESRRLGRDRVHYITHVEVNGSAAEEESVEVVLRYPLSELKALRVLRSEAHCSRPFTPDGDGLIRFEVKLGAGQERFKFAFYFEKSSQVVLPEPWYTEESW